MFAWYQDLRLTLKLRLAFAVMAIITAAVGVGGLITMTMLKSRVQSAYNQDLPAVSAIKEAGISQLKAMRVLLRVVLAAGDPDGITKQNLELAQNLASERKQLNLCMSKLRSKEGRNQLSAAEKMIPKFEKGAADIVTAAKAGDVIGFRTTITDLVPISDQIQHSFDQVTQLTEKQASLSQILAATTYWGALTLMVPLVIFSFLFAAALSFFMSSAIALPLARMAKVLDLVAKGDLTQKLPESEYSESGQVGRSLNRALASLRATLQQVSYSSNDVKEASDNVSAAANFLADGTATQAASLESTTASLERISANIRKNADHTSRANQLGTSARHAAEKGDESVASAIGAMQAIRDSSDEISNILSAIHDIAFQSNLLAINASIEAARAGEGGRSFAVVATEMRYLADRSKQSGKDIERLLATSIDRVSNGEKLVNRSGQALGEIIASVSNLSTTVREIDIACNHQSQGVEQVASQMTTVDGVLQTNIQKTQGLSTTAQELALLASQLNDMLTHFTFEGQERKTEALEDDFVDQWKVLRDWYSKVLPKLRLPSLSRKITPS